MTASPPSTLPPLRDVVLRAWDRRTQFDLHDVGYGRIHWGNKSDIVTKPYSYYYFLAGFVNEAGIRNIIEIGTHQGGSAMALAAGLRQPENSRIVTFDVTSDGAERFKEHPVIRSFTMDANSEAAFEICAHEFSDRPVDLLYIDAVHSFWPTLLSFLIYNTTFAPTFVILDDITLNDEMIKAWNLLRMRFGDDALDATEVAEGIRPPTPTSRPGFGVVRCSDRVLFNAPPVTLTR